MIQTANRQNPFPGMNPYLEQHWRDVHTTLMVYLRDQLQGELPEGDVALDLQSLIDLCYERGRYHARLDYRAEPEPPLSPPDAEWADQLLGSAGLR
jgi:hypothetical protein